MNISTTPLEPRKYVRDRGNSSVDHSTKSRAIIEISLIFFNMKVCCVFSLESPHRSDSNEYTQYTIFNIKKKKMTINCPRSAAI